MADMPDYHMYVVPVTVSIPTGESPISDVAKYLETPEAIADGERGPLLIDQYGRAYVIIYGVPEIDHAKIKGVALKDPTVAASVPISIENDAIAYDAVNNLFYVKIAAGGTATPTTYSPPSTLLAGDKDVSAAATPEALAASTPVLNSVLVQAKTGNTGSVFVGNATEQHVELSPGRSHTLVVDDLAKIYIKVAVNGEGVNYDGS